MEAGKKGRGAQAFVCFPLFLTVGYEGLRPWVMGSWKKGQCAQAFVRFSVFLTIGYDCLRPWVTGSWKQADAPELLFVSLCLSYDWLRLLASLGDWGPDKKADAPKLLLVSLSFLRLVTIACVLG